MPAWRLRWLLRTLCSAANRRRQRAVLQNAWTYYLALISGLLPDRYFKPRILSLVDGPRFLVGHLMTIYIYHEVFLDRIYDVDLRDDETPTIIDVGANVGLFALWAKHRWPSSMIACFEPEKRNYAALAKNLALNGFRGVRAYNVAVSSRCQRATLYLHPRNHGGHSLYPEVARGCTAREVETLDVASALRLLGAERCSVLKLDCEGCEYAILAGLEPSVASRIDRILYEPTPSLYDPKALNFRLRDLGYAVSYRRGLFEARRNTA